MEENSSQPDTIDIRCPECRARFSVSQDLMGRVVECGGCDSQFPVNDETVIHSKKSYPGEKRDTNAFRRAPLTSIEMPKGFQSINYGDIKRPEVLEPASPLQLIAGACGVGIMIFGALILLLSIKPSSLLGGMPLDKQLIVAGFTSLLGIGLLIYANRNRRFIAGFIGLILAAGVVSIPVFLKEKPSKPQANQANAGSQIPQQEIESDPADPIQLLRERFMTRPLETEQKRLIASNIDKQAYGVYLTGMLGRNKLNARDYLIRETLAGVTSHPFPRDLNDYLMVLTEVEMDIEQVARVAGKLGEITETHPEINLIVVKVDNEKFVGETDDKLSDQTHSAFYELNLQELQSIDIGRIQKAVERLAQAEAKVLRSDIGRALGELLNKPGVTFHDSLARALLKWSDNLDEISDRGLEILSDYAAFGTSPPEHLVKLVSDQRKPEAIPTLMQFWEANPVLWDDDLVKFGPAVEPELLKKLNTSPLPLQRAIIKTLGRIGTKNSLEALRQQQKQTDPEIRVLAERAITQIQQR